MKRKERRDLRFQESAVSGTEAKEAKRSGLSRRLPAKDRDGPVLAATPKIPGLHEGWAAYHEEHTRVLSHAIEVVLGLPFADGGLRVLDERAARLSLQRSHLVTRKPPVVS